MSLKPSKPTGHDDNLNIPVPDPSLLTTAALDREVFALRELLEVKLGANTETTALSRKVLETRLDEIDRATLARVQTFTEKISEAWAAERQSARLVRAIIETRLDGMDKAIRLLQDTADKFPARIDEKIGALQSVHDQKFEALVDTHGEKFLSIQTQFRERDVRTEQSSKDSKVAVDAALQAAKEAVGEQNRSSALAIAKSEAATTKQIDQLGVQMQTNSKASDDKITDLKERITRIEGMGTGGSLLWGYVIGGVGALLGLAGFVLMAFRMLGGKP